MNRKIHYGEAQGTDYHLLSWIMDSCTGQGLRTRCYLWASIRKEGVKVATGHRKAQMGTSRRVWLSASSITLAGHTASSIIQVQCNT